MIQISNNILKSNCRRDFVTHSSKDAVSGREISKLVFQISNACNLKCSYCCAKKGLFESKEPKMMPPTIALDSLDLFAKSFRKIRNIYLFGGEPTLNLTVIDMVCEKIAELVEQGHLIMKPKVGLTTNGTLMVDEFIQLVQEHDLNVGVSLDGTQTIHDKLRMDSYGKGTYLQIIENVRSARNQTQQPSSIELTYTPIHLNSSIQLWDILEALNADTDINIFSITPAYDVRYVKKESQFSADPFMHNPQKVINEMVDVLKKSMRAMATSKNPIILSTIIIFLQQFSQENNNYNNKIISCPAGSEYFTIAFDGTIYPCQNLPENDYMRIGQIYEADIETKILK